MAPWQFESWKTFPNKQAINYENTNLLGSVLSKLQKMPPLVSYRQIIELKQTINEVQQGKAFILQGGDCAEMFKDFTYTTVLSLIKTLQDTAMLIHAKSGLKINIIGRFAGQFGKPRSNLFEIKKGEALESYRGDMINQLDFDALYRQPNPKRMLDSYFHSSALLNFLSQMAHHQKQGLTDRLFSSHELFNLYYEQSLLKQSQEDNAIYESSGHLLWIGNRTRDFGCAHLEFARGIANPIGIKIDAQLSDEELVQILQHVNPTNEAGKIILIIRMGRGSISRALPPLLKIIKEYKLHVAWLCDPMHGNTFITNKGSKARLVEDVLAEINLFIQLCKKHNVFPGGLHLEMSGDESIKECLYEVELLTEFAQNYKSGCDPRLSPEQVTFLMHQINW